MKGKKRNLEKLKNQQTIQAAFKKRHVENSDQHS